MWHVVRVKLRVLCSSTRIASAITTFEDAPDTVKAESRDTCKRYVKVLYQVRDRYAGAQ